MTLAYYGKSKGRRAVLAFGALVALLAATLGGLTYLGSARATQFSIHTSIQNVTPTSKCPNGGGNGVDCNIYSDKTQVYLDGGPATSFLPDGTYCFAVYNTSGSTLLSTDLASARVFSIASNVTTYAGGHTTGSDSRAAPATTTIGLAPFSDSSNGEYKLIVYQYADPAPSQGSSADCVDNPHGVTKSDNFKVGVVVTLPSLSKSSGSYNTANDTATWTVTIANTGANATSQDVVITDSGATMTAFAGGTCTGTLPDTDGTFNCTVAGGGTLTLTVTKVIGQACTAGSVTNTASATVGAVAIQNSPVTSSPALVIPADQTLCSVPTLAKSSGSYNTANDTATWTITIDNTGANAISRDIIITDSGATMTAFAGGTCTGTLPDADGTFNCTVAAGGTLTLTVTKVIGQACAAGSVTNTASATVGAVGIQNSPVTSSPALVIPADTSLCPAPGINIQKTPDSQTVLVGGTASFTITVTNTGNVTLTNVSVSDSLAPGCGRTAAQFDALDPGTFDAGDVVTYNCTLANVQAGFTNSATATGSPPTGADVTSTDTAVVLVQAPSIGIQKNPDSQTIVAGGTATFTITVTNTGTVTLSNVSVSDAQASGCARTAAEFDALDPGTFDSGDVVTYSCSLTNVLASFVNSATATGTPPTGPAVSATDTAAVTVVVPPVVVVVPLQPTPTTVPPTATPVPPTPVNTVQGERTPGPVSTAAGEKTPGPPQTGSGLGSRAGSVNILLAVVGLLALSAGLAFVAVGRGKNRA